MFTCVLYPAMGSGCARRTRRAATIAGGQADASLLCRRCKCLSSLSFNNTVYVVPAWRNVCCPYLLTLSRADAYLPHSICVLTCAGRGVLPRHLSHPCSLLYHSAIHASCVLGGRPRNGWHAANTPRFHCWRTGTRYIHLYDIWCRIPSLPSIPVAGVQSGMRGRWTSFYHIGLLTVAVLARFEDRLVLALRTVCLFSCMRVSRGRFRLDNCAARRKGGVRWTRPMLPACPVIPCLVALTASACLLLYARGRCRAPRTNGRLQDLQDAAFTILPALTYGTPSLLCATRMYHLLLSAAF